MSNITSNTSPLALLDSSAVIDAAKLVALFSSKSVDVKSTVVSDFEKKFANEIAYVKTLAQEDPVVLNSISESLNKIVADGKVNIHDIPEIVLVISNIVKINFRKIVNNISILSVAEYILHAILDSGLLPIPGVQKEILSKVVSVSFQLLDTDAKAIEAGCKKCWFSCSR